MKISNLFIVVLGVLIMYSSCSIEKRHYRTGYYISNNNHGNSSVNLEEKIQYEEHISTDLTASKEIEVTPVLNLFIVDTIPIIDTCGDFILLKNGSKLKVKVLDVFSTAVLCKPCNNLSGPTRRISTEDIKTIQYQNGTVQNFEKETFEKVDENGEKYYWTVEPKDEILAKRSLACGLVGTILLVLALLFLFTGVGGFSFGIFFFLFALFFGLILGIIAIRSGQKSNAHQNSSKTNSKTSRKSKVGVTLGVILTIITSLTIFWIGLRIFSYFGS